ncbi:MAG TPA: chitobiase/beta-hexosaminidase C-terminal domain-containing protein, partial [Spirochaetota bacterium]|nr:chitobiase/beta-hexosaminidase C-terminal domain-containing protein [Spirochaetota bacterium]
MKNIKFLTALFIITIALFSCNNSILSLKTEDDADRVRNPVIFANQTEAASQISVTFSCDTPDAKIIFTIDNSNPSKKNGTTISNGQSYGITSSATVKAIAIKDDLIDSEIVSKTFKINGKLLSPVLTTSKTMQVPEQISIFVASGTTVKYTIESSTYSTSQTISLTINKSTTITAIATKENFTDSETATATYTFTGECPPPALSMSNNFNSATEVSIFVPEFKDEKGVFQNPKVYYTLDNSDPRESSNTARVEIDKDTKIMLEENKTTRLKACTILTNWSTSSVSSSIYTVTGQ